ncbi:MAG: PDDEXK nuclease domain-containing protein [Lachnospiraceae bacterium]|nr:PDDEXK nuclease domain-containing protein [Lachnospiraceae bacterium]
MGIKDIDKIGEKKVENAIISHLQKFLLEMGKGFCFVDRQMYISTETTDFYIDLVFYNYILSVLC